MSQKINGENLTCLLLMVYLVVSKRYSFSMDSLFLVIISSFTAGLLLAPSLRSIAFKWGVTDKPGLRKLHVGDVPLIGGPLILLVTFMGSLLLSVDFPVGAFIAGSFIVLLGVFDDKYDVPASPKFFLQVAIACLLISIDSAHIVDIGIYQKDFANPANQILHFGLAVLAIVIGVNALNLIDGIDGLAASIVLVILINANLAFVVSGQSVPKDILLHSALLAGALCSFLAFNLSLIDGKKIFLGDSGSMLIGLLITSMLINISQTPSSSSGITIPASLCLWLTALPMTDMLVTFMKRILNGKSPFSPDRRHLHHRLKDIGLSKWHILIVILTASAIIFWGGAAITFQFGETASLIAYGVYMVSYAIFINALDRAQAKAD